jgi:hypothetical protein
MNETFVVPCWNVTLLFVVMNSVNKQRMIDNQTYVKHILQLAGEENLVDVETDSSYGSNFKYSLTIDGVKVFFYKLGFCGSHRLAGTVISPAISDRD